MAKRDFGAANFANDMKKTMEKAEAKSNAVTAINIRLDLIDENPDNNKIFNMDDIERLAKTIEQEGFSGAIEVLLKEDGRYEISAGHRRYRAVKLLGWPTIPAIVSSSDDNIRKRKKLIKSNINNRNMKPMDWARTIAYHRDTLCMEDAKLQGKVFTDGESYTCAKSFHLWDRMEEDFGLKKTTMYKYLKLLKLIPEIQKLVDDGSIPPLAISSLGNDTEETQRLCYEKLREQLSLLVSTDDEKPTLPVSTVLNISKSVSAKIGMQENKDRRNEEYFNFMSAKDNPVSNEEDVDFAPIDNEGSLSQKYEPLPFQADDAPIAPVPFLEPIMNPIERNLDNIPYDKPVVPIPPIITEQPVLGDTDMKQPEKEVTYFDTEIIRVSNELNLIANRDVAVKDKDNIIDRLNQIEEFIKIIRNKIV